MFEALDKLLATDSFTEISPVGDIRLKDGERRNVAILFADIKGFTAMSEKLDPEQVQTVLDKLLLLFTQCIKQHGGYIDKYEGDLVMALFGAKVASERDTERAIHAALQMMLKLKEFNTALCQIPAIGSIELGVRIGINTGLVTTGRVGEKREGDFTVYGDAVNLASRMESNAPVNRIMIPIDTMRIVEDAFDLEDFGNIKVKGKARPISVYLVKGVKSRQAHRWLVRKSAYVGRDKELALLSETYNRVRNRLIDPVKAGNSDDTKPAVIGIMGRAGLGKSRLVYEFQKNFLDINHVLQGTTSRIAQHPYALFISMLKRYLDILPSDSPAISKEKLETGLDRLEAGLSPPEKLKLRDTLPLTGFLLGLKFDDKRLKLNGKELQPHLQMALRFFIEAVAALTNLDGEPLPVIFDDLHWIDDSSKAMLDFLLITLNLEEKREQRPLRQIFFLFLYRPDFELPPTVKMESEFTEIVLEPFDQDDAGQLIESMVGSIDIPAEVRKQLIAKSDGNPFYIEEWINLISEYPPFLSFEELPLPDSLNALVLSRIDQLEKDVKLILQEASVVGREFFSEILVEIEKKLARSPDIAKVINRLEFNEFIQQQLGSQYSAYMFKQVLIQEVAYNTLLIANRKVLHGIVAEIIEELFADQIDKFYYDLAEHYSFIDNTAKAVYYLEKAGDEARISFDNEKAIAFYNRLLNYCDDRAQAEKFIDILLKKNYVMQITGQLDECLICGRKALHLAEQTGDADRIGKVCRVLGDVALRQGDYSQTIVYFERALQIATELDDKDGMSRAVGNLGIARMRQGKLDQAMDLFKKKLEYSKQIASKIGIFKSYGSIGLIHAYRSNQDEAMKYFQKKLEICREMSVKQEIAAVTGNMGILHHQTGRFDRAMTCYREFLETAEELGNLSDIARVTGNIGVLYAETGDFEAAMNCYRNKLSIVEKLGEKMEQCLTLINIGLLLRNSDPKSALAYFDRAVTIGREIEFKRGLCAGLIYKAKELYKLNDYHEARLWNMEGLEIAREIKRKDMIFQGNLLSAKINFALNLQSQEFGLAPDPDNDPIAILTALLNKTDNALEKAEENAEIYYELAKMHNQKEDELSQPLAAQCKNDALRIYRELFEKIHRFEYKRRIEELGE
ncbi:MAG: tetratricopeptide repeat protein [Planctomycetes bacterium]|nr:tetratricopeptide repeat protein [Planctomycetota bacterium]